LLARIAAAHGHLVWMTVVAMFSCVAAMVTDGMIFITVRARTLHRPILRW
jgi:hypothetical protein